MACGKVIGILVKYIPFVGILAVHILSLFRGVTTITGEINRSVYIWTYALLISADIGELGSLLVLDRFNILLTEKTPNIVTDIAEESSQDVAVMYNGVIASSLFITAIFTLNIIYVSTENRLFSTISVVLSTLWAIGTVVYLFAGYLQIKHTHPQSILSNLSNPVILPALICMIQILITRKNWVGYIYCNIYKPENGFLLTLALITVLCYFLAVAFCHFSNIYCLIGFKYIKHDLDKIQKQIDCLHEKREQQEATLRQETKEIDEKAEQIGFIQRCMLIFRFCFIHIKTYFQGRYNAASYLLSLFNFKITKRFKRLLNPERVKINGIRFCLITSVLELLSLDFILFVYFESYTPCLKFFELLSTVIIIPILLSWLAELKSKVNEKIAQERR